LFPGLGVFVIVVAWLKDENLQKEYRSRSSPEIYVMKRRDFLATAAATIAVTPARADESPLRSKPLKAGYYGTQYYDDQERRELVEVLEKRQPFRWYGPGSQPPRKVADFEAALARRMKVRHALAVTSGTAALSTALAALQVGPGDEVILPAWTWYSCYNAIVLAGALPVFAEIDESLNLDPEDVARRITPQTRVIMAVHLLGNPCDMDHLLKLAQKHKLKVLEDCAQSLGADYQGRPVGSLGDIGIFSMQLHKTITAGEGGAVVTNDPVLFERASRYHDLGMLRSPHETAVGGAHLQAFAGSQYRMNEFTGGVLLAQMRKLDTIVAALRAHARYIYDRIADVPGIHLRHRPDPAGDLGSALGLQFESKARRDHFIKAMHAENLPAGPPFGSVLLPVQPHIENKATVHPAWPSFTSKRGKAIRYGAACCPRTIDLLDRQTAIGLDPKFSRQDVDDIVAGIRKALSSK
jgi:8-amino-3,8-dideoxy-alpha-D-manno-octulosonate transaminase